MRLLILVAFTASLWADITEEIDFRGNIGPEYQYYHNKPDGKYSENTGIAAELESVYDGEYWYVKSWMKGFVDSKEDERDFLRLDELFAMYRADEWEAALGRRIFFWGALEVYNPVDILNPQDTLYDPFDPDAKKGVNTATYSHFFEESQLDVLIKAGEAGSSIGDEDSPYNLYSVYFNPELSTSHGTDTPGIYLKYSGSTDWDYPLDYAFAFTHGYDNQRYLFLNADSELQERAYRANKYLMWHTWVVDATLLKLESSYTDVLDDENVGDYWQLGLGMEHTLEQLFSGNDLGLIAEYYTYNQSEDSLLGRDALSNIFQNDLFLGLRLTLNDASSTEIVGGGIFDLNHHDEQTFYVEAQRRIFDHFMLEMDVRHIEPGNDVTRFNQLGRHTRTKASFKYYF